MNDSPAENLKFLSDHDTLQGIKALYPITPDRVNKTAWIMDAWDTERSDSNHKRSLQKYSHRIIEDYSSNKIRIKKSENLKLGETPYNDKYLTPRQEKQSQSMEKQNKYRFRLHSKTLKRSNDHPVQNICSFKVSIESIVYPLAKKSLRDKSRRIDRFHSFVARNIRK